MLNEQVIILNGARQKLLMERKGVTLVGGPWFKKIKKALGLKANTRKDAVEEIDAMLANLK